MKLFFKCIFITLLLGIILCFSSCGKKEKIYCSFEFINPDTGESIKPTGTIGYEDVYLTYDGNQKNIKFKIIRNDNGKEVQIIESIDIIYTYKNPKTGNYEYGKPYMLNPGEYVLSIKDCCYKDDKYNLTYLDVALTIFIQEEGAAKDIELNVPYPINIKENESLKFTFITPYSMCYKISAEEKQHLK